METYGVVGGVTAQSDPLCTARPLPKGAWTHVAAVYDSASGRRTVLLNGTVAGSDEQRGDAHDDPETPLLIGAHLDRRAAWSKWPSWWRHSRPPRAPQTAAEAAQVAISSAFDHTGHMPAGLFHGEIDDVRVWSQARTRPHAHAGP
tara:strand:- start:186 stop:623 length:438 start_codon:yes stop_codon:yes gene_type:complete